MIPDDVLRSLLADTARAAPVGSTWTHRNGNRYVVCRLCLVESTCEPAVVYHRHDDPSLCWCRPAAEFLGGRFTRGD